MGKLIKVRKSGTSLIMTITKEIAALFNIKKQTVYTFT